MFSKRTQWDITAGDLAQAWQQRQLAGRLCFDLTLSNPTAAAFAYDLSAAAEVLAAATSAPYEPIPFGLPTACAAVSAYYRNDHALDIPTDRILLTVSTSEAYSYLFRLLCDPGEEVLYCQPGYPLFDYLADLDDVRLSPVSWLHDADGWHLDRGGFDQARTAKTRAVLIVHPNNPTGHFTSPQDRQWLDQWCAQHHLALIVDEVFLDYPLGVPQPSFLATTGSETSAQAATFVLSGISKISGLPQMKVAWIILHGPSTLIDEAARRLDVIADTFLSVSTPLQIAVPALLEIRRQIQPQIQFRLRQNLATLDDLLAGPSVTRPSLVTRLEASAGWYACLRIPAHEPSESSAIRLLQQTGVYVHPGDFFAFPIPGIWIVSLLTPADQFQAGITRLINHIQHFE